MDVLIIMAVVFMVCIGIYFSKVQHDKRCRDWAEAAFQTGLRYVASSEFFQMGAIFGKLGGLHDINISTIKEGAGKNAHTLTQYILDLAENAPCDFTIRKENFFSIATKMLKFKDIEVDDADFDKLARISSHGPPEDVKKFLTHQRKAAIAALLKTCKDVEITNRSVIIKNMGVDEKDRLLACIAMLESLAKTFNPNLKDSSREKPQTSRKAPDSELKTTEHKFKKTYSFKLDGSKPLEDATDIKPPPIPTEHARTETFAVSSQIKSKETLTPPKEAVRENKNSPTESQSSLSKQDFMEKFFPKDSFLADCSADFEKLFKGKHVEWDCILKNARKTAFDLDFAEFKGVRAEGMISSGNEPSARKDEIVAVLALPENSFESLNSKIGKRIYFKGKLVKIDTFLRKVFIEADIV